MIKIAQLNPSYIGTIMPTLLITGTNRGIGLELTRQYLSEGWNVVATCRHPENANALHELKQQYDSTLDIAALDVSNYDQITDLKQSLKNTPIDLLINNAGVYCAGANRLGESDEKVWEHAVKVNVLAPIKMIEHFADNVSDSEMKTIVSISSKMGSMGDNGSGGAYAYRATKAALNAVMVSAAHDLGYRGIKVLILHPGWARTDMGGPHGEISATESATMLKRNIANSTMEDSGTFMDIDGSIIPW